MADETTEHDDFDGEDPSELDEPTMSEAGQQHVDGDPESNASTYDDAEDLADGDPGTGDEDEVGWGPGAHVLGTLRLSYPSRDIDLFMDWDAARRLLTMVRTGYIGGLQDSLDHRSNGHAGWIVARIDEPLAAAWLPGHVETARPRMASVDPPAVG